MAAGVLLPFAEGSEFMRKALGLYLLGVPVGLIIVVMLFTKAC